MHRWRRERPKPCSLHSFVTQAPASDLVGTSFSLDVDDTSSRSSKRKCFWEASSCIISQRRFQSWFSQRQMEVTPDYLSIDSSAAEACKASNLFTHVRKFRAGLLPIPSLSLHANFQSQISVVFGIRAKKSLACHGSSHRWCRDGMVQGDIDHGNTL